VNGQTLGVRLAGLGCLAALLAACPPPPTPDSGVPDAGDGAGLDAGGDGGVDGGIDAGSDAGDPHRCDRTVVVDAGRLCLSLLDLSPALAPLGGDVSLAGGNAGFSAVATVSVDGGASRRFVAVVLDRAGGLAALIAVDAPAPVRDTDETGALCGALPRDGGTRPALFLADGGRETAPTGGACVATSGEYWAGGGGGAVFFARRGQAPLLVPGRDGGTLNGDEVVGVTARGELIVNTLVEVRGVEVPTVARLAWADAGTRAPLADDALWRPTFASVANQQGVVFGTGVDGLQPLAWSGGVVQALARPADTAALDVISASDDGAGCGFVATAGGEQRAVFWLGPSLDLVDVGELGLEVNAPFCTGALPGGRFLVYAVRATDGGFVASTALLRLTRP